MMYTTTKTPISVTPTSPPPGSSGSIAWSPGTTTPSTITVAAPKTSLVDLPSRMTGKVLIAFLGEDDEATWAKKLMPMDVSINYDSSGMARMTIELSLAKVYDD